MRQTTRGSEVTEMSSDRAPFYSDATVDAYQTNFGTTNTGLLTAGQSKTIVVVDNTNMQPNENYNLSGNIQAITISGVAYNLIPAVGRTVTIVNESGEDASVEICVCHGDQPWNKSQIRVPFLPYIIPSGEAASAIFLRAAVFIEKNIGVGTQTGRGLRYYVELERQQH